MKTFRRIAATVLLGVIATVTAEAQRIQTVDKNGSPVACASVMTEDARFIGATSLDGVLEDVKGAKKVIITHVAYQSKTVEVGQGGKITLEEADFEQYRYDGQSPYSPEDLMMRQVYTSYDKENSEGKMINRVIMCQVFNTERAYVTKDELKQLKKQNKMKMTYDNLQRFEREHKIPALAQVIQKRIDDLAAGKKK